jgi:hypothetical protein
MSIVPALRLVGLWLTCRPTTAIPRPAAARVISRACAPRSSGCRTAVRDPAGHRTSTRERTLCGQRFAALSRTWNRIGSRWSRPLPAGSRRVWRRNGQGIWAADPPGVMSTRNFGARERQEQARPIASAPLARAAGRPRVPGRPPTAVQSAAPQPRGPGTARHTQALAGPTASAAGRPPARMTDRTTRRPRAPPRPRSVDQPRASRPATWCARAACAGRGGGRIEMLGERPAGQAQGQPRRLTSGRRFAARPFTKRLRAGAARP